MQLWLETTTNPKKGFEQYKIIQVSKRMDNEHLMEISVKAEDVNQQIPTNVDSCVRYYPVATSPHEYA